MDKFNGRPAGSKAPERTVPDVFEILGNGTATVEIYCRRTGRRALILDATHDRYLAHDVSEWEARRDESDVPLVVGEKL